MFKFPTHKLENDSDATEPNGDLHVFNEKTFGLEYISECARINNEVLQKNESQLKGISSSMKSSPTVLNPPRATRFIPKRITVQFEHTYNYSQEVVRLPGALVFLDHLCCGTGILTVLKTKVLKQENTRLFTRLTSINRNIGIRCPLTGTNS